MAKAKKKPAPEQMPPPSSIPYMDPVFLVEDEESAGYFASVLASLVTSINPGIHFSTAQELLTDMLLAGMDPELAHQNGKLLLLTVHPDYQRARH